MEKIVGRWLWDRSRTSTAWPRLLESSVRFPPGPQQACPIAWRGRAFQRAQAGCPHKDGAVISWQAFSSATGRELDHALLQRRRMRRDQLDECRLGYLPWTAGNSAEPLLQPHIVQPQRGAAKPIQLALQRLARESVVYFYGSLAGRARWHHARLPETHISDKGWTAVPAKPRTREQPATTLRQVSLGSPSGYSRRAAGTWSVRYPLLASTDALPVNIFSMAASNLVSPARRTDVLVTGR